MSTQRISVRIPKKLSRRLHHQSKRRRQPASQIVREALERFLPSKDEPTAYDRARELGLIGCAPGLPKDLSTNPRHMKGFGKSK